MTSSLPTAPVTAPLIARCRPLRWLQKNLFNSWFNGLITIVLGGLLLWGGGAFFSWAIVAADWRVIPANLPLYFVGRYPADQYWRLWLMLALIGALSGLTWGVLARRAVRLFTVSVLVGLSLGAIGIVLIPTPPLYRLLGLGIALVSGVSAWGGQQLARQFARMGQWVSLLWAITFWVSLWLIRGGLGLKVVSTNDWGGLLLTLIMSLASMLLCFPLGVLLALGRQSDLPVVRGLSTAYIELVRGVPLISILFMGQVMIPLFLPEGVRPDRVVRAILGLTLFSAAYLAENVRGGLQAIPRGQLEAAHALGLNAPLTVGLIVLPQAIKIAIPAIVGQFIGLFQDTTLLSIVGLLELLGISRAILANPEFLGKYGETYLFIGVIYWGFCYAMSIASRRLEQHLSTGQR
ncbi:amino acid ABC transporter permease [Trichothermofontia sp.]